MMPGWPGRHISGAGNVVSLLPNHIKGSCGSSACSHSSNSFEAGAPGFVAVLLQVVEVDRGLGIVGVLCIR